ncbi:hypothetical protein Tco_0696161 [Tanacetum coccineum]
MHYPHCGIRMGDLLTFCEHNILEVILRFQVRGSCLYRQSLNFYASLPQCFVSPHMVGPSFPVSSARLASLLRYTRSPGPLPLFFSVGMPISAGMTASISYVNENGVSPLLDFIMTAICSFYQAISLRMFNKSKVLADTYHRVKRDRTFEFGVNLGSEERVFWGPPDSIAKVMEGMRDDEIDRFLDDNSSIV